MIGRNMSNVLFIVHAFVILSAALSLLLGNSYALFTCGLIQILVMTCLLYVDYKLLRRVSLFAYVVISHIFFMNAYMAYAVSEIAPLYITKFGSAYSISNATIHWASFISIIALFFLSLPRHLRLKPLGSMLPTIRLSNSIQLITISMIWLSLICLSVDSYSRFSFFAVLSNVEDKYTSSFYSFWILSLMKYIVVPLIFVLSVSRVRYASYFLLLYLVITLMPGMLTLDRSSLLTVLLYWFWHRAHILKIPTTLSSMLIYFCVALLPILLMTFLRINMDPELFIGIIGRVLVSQADTFMLLSYALETVPNNSYFSNASVFYDFYNFFLNRNGVSVAQTNEYISVTSSMSHLLTFHYSNSAYLVGKGLGTSYLIEILSLPGSGNIPTYILYVSIAAFFIGYLSLWDRSKVCSLPAFFTLFSWLVFIVRAPLLIPLLPLLSVAFFFVLYTALYFGGRRA